MKRAILVLLAVILLMQSAAVLAEKRVFAYQGNVAFFEENGLMGLQDKAGKVLHEAEFVSAEPFDVNDIAQVYLADGSQGFIDRTGKYAIEPMRVKDMGYKQVEKIIMLDKVVYTTTNGKAGLVSLSGEALLPAEYDEIYPFSTGENYVKLGEKWLLVDNQGNQLSGRQFDDVEPYNMLGIIYDANWKAKHYTPDGICVYAKSSTGVQYADEQGNPLPIGDWDELFIEQWYKEGYIIGLKGRKFGIMDVQGKTILEPEWYSVFRQSPHFFMMLEGPYQPLYTFNGQTKKVKKLDLGDGNLVDLFGVDYLVYKNEKQQNWGFADYEGNILSTISNQYEKCKGRYISDGYLYTLNKGQIYFFDAYGSITSREWEKASDFHEGLAAVQIKGKWGYVNQKGETAIAPVWDGADDFAAAYGPAMAKVYKDGKPYGWINSKGEVVCLYRER